MKKPKPFDHLLKRDYMSVLIFADQAEGHIKKAALEAISYGAGVAAVLQTNATALVLGPVSKEDAAALGKYGVQKVLVASTDIFGHLDGQVYAQAVAQAAGQENATVIIFPHNPDGKAVAPRVAARLKAGLVTGATSLPDVSGGGFVVRKNVFSGKAIAGVSITSPVKVISLNPNSYPLKETGGAAEVVDFQPTVTVPKVKVTKVDKVVGEVPLSEAEIVVSGGRGLKGPENWGIVEDLAHALGAATACSRPVADSGWRPHHEHVGQTGLTIRPNLYIAIGISGAIQHLAGVNGSKVIVVINKDPEAPFFKAADYGIVGDAFDVVPKMTAAIKQLKGIS
jgi:electron transfer flavoprotein alpha subunit